LRFIAGSFALSIGEPLKAALALSVYCQDLARELARVLAREHLTRRELRRLEFSGESGIPRADTLGRLAIYPFYDPARDGSANSAWGKELASRTR
jgi:hypothetical protein